jgi:hypothetical protein
MQDRPVGRVAALVPAIVAERARLAERILADVRAAAGRAGAAGEATADAGATKPGPGRRAAGPATERSVGAVGPIIGLDEAEERRLVEASLDWIVGRLRADGVVDAAALEPLREAGAAAARRGEPVARPLDRVLSAGWVIWEAAVHGGLADGPALAALGGVLLRIGDAAAAAIAAGHAEAEREAAARAAAARREFLDELLDLPAGDAEAAARIVRRAGALGLDPTAAFDLLVADVGRELGDEDPELGRLLAVVGAAPPPRPFGSRGEASDGTAVRRSGLGPIAGTRAGRLVVLAETRWPRWSRLVEALGALAGGGRWVAVRARGAEGIVAVAGAAGTAVAALRVAVRLGLHGRVLDPADLALERLVLGDEALARAAIAAELGPLLTDRRTGRALAETLAAYVASRGNARATARRLGVAPRTVAYRLERARRLLGRPLEGEGLLRLAAALVVDAILARSSRPEASPAPTEDLARRQPRGGG